MKKERPRIEARVRLMIIIVLTAISAILASSVFLIHQWDIKGEADKVIINVLGRQRMLTQMIAKDATRLYALEQAVETGATYQVGETADFRIGQAKNNLREAKAAFSETLAAMHGGYLSADGLDVDIRRSIQKSNEYLSRLDDMWARYSEAIDVLVASDGTNEKTALALLYINDNNLSLLSLSDAITQSVTDDSIGTTKRVETLFVALEILLFFIVAVSLRNLHRYIVRPFSELYRGISEIGLGGEARRHEKNGFRLPRQDDLAPVVSEIKGAFAKLGNLISLIENITGSSSFPETLDFINRTFSAYVPYNYIGIALYDKTNHTLRAAYGVSDGSVTALPRNLMGKTAGLEKTSLGKVLETGEARVINDLELHVAGRPLAEYNRIILDAGVRASITLPLRISDEPVGIIFFSSTRANVYTPEHVKFLTTLTSSLAISFDKNVLIEELLFGTILSLAKLAEARDEDTGDHLGRMKQYTRLIAQLCLENGLYPETVTADYVDNIERFSPLHDIGKVGIRDGILLKPGSLTPAEFEEMKHHTVYGAEVLRAAESSLSSRNRHFFSLGIEIAEGHHERWDGSGYPAGKAGAEIPVSARIVAVADVFDALTSARPYKEPFSFESSLEQIAAGSGSHFDPAIAAVFLKNRNRVLALHRTFHP